MANDYNASVNINTGAAEQGIKNLDVAAGNLDKTLRALHSTLQSGQKDLDAIAKSMTEATRANAAMIKSETDRARATQAAARADRERIINEGKMAEAINKTAESKAKQRRIDGQTQNSAASTQAANQRKDLESATRVAGAAAVASQRVTNEQTRGAVAAANLDNATSRAAASADRAAMTNSRLADSQERARNASLGLNDSLSNSRYLLYDVGQTYTVLSAALLAIPTATAAVAIAYEKDFAQVIRTNDSLAQSENGFTNLRQDLKDLATQIPLTFGQFSNIATIGGQLNISGSEISQFTETVARFGAASNVGLEEAATAFGRFEQSFPDARTTEDYFNKVGSSIAYVGVKSAATETEIIAVANQITAAGAQFGFATQDVIGLSGALASVRIRPEMARGAFQRIMLGLSSAADDGAESFSKFGKYTGLAAEESMALFKSDPAQFFYKYVGGIKDAIAATGSVSSVLDDIGAKNVFDKQFLLGLANGYDVFGQSMQNATQAFNDGTFLNASTEGVFNTMDAKIQRISNSLKNLADTMAKGALAENGGLVKVADTILNIVSAADRFAKANAGFTAFLNTALALGGAVGILLAFKAAQAFVLAGLVGFQQVLGKTSIAAGLTLKGNINELSKTFLMMKGASAEAATGLIQNTGAMRAMGFAASATNVQMRALNAGLGTAGTTANAQAAGGMRSFTGGLKGAWNSVLGFVGGPLGLLITGLVTIGTMFLQTGEQAAQAGEAIARGLGEGAQAGVRAAADALKNRKVGWGDGLIAFTDMDKSLVEIAKQSGVSFDALVNAATKGKDAVAAITPELDRVAQSKGFQNFQDMYDNGGSDVAGLVLLRNAVRDIGNEADKSATGTKAADNAVKSLTGTTGEAIDPTSQLGKELNSLGDEAQTAEEKLDAFLNKVFGIANAEMASQAALQALGESIGNSTDFGPNSEGGRDNVKNFQDAIRAAIQEQQNLIDTTGKSTAQASADYIAYVDALVQEMANHGVDPTRVQFLADQAKTYFADGLATGAIPEVPVKVDESAAQQTAAALPATLQNFIYAQQIPEIGVNAKTDEAQSKTMQLVYWLADITGWPYEVVMDALTNPASDKATEVYALLTSITDGTYVAPVDADTSAAITNVQNFASWARQELANIQYAMQGLGPGGIGIDASVESITAAKKKYAAFAPLAAGAAAPKQVKATPAPAAPKINPVTPNLGGLKDGYDKVKDAAQKAGDAGKKAGQDMADGIDDATRAADDYANRLKTGLQSAFDQQYGLQKATDEYHKTLNDIAKKREDDVKQISDLIDKQKELNNERDKSLVDARKAGIEKNISMKYGEVDRAADYANQEKEALDAAAAKQKDISANNSTIVSLQNGLNAFDGYSDAAIANREALRNLEQKMLDMVVAYAATGASVEQVRAYSQQLTAQFQIDAGQVFQNQGAVNNLTGEMGRYIDTINRIPYVKPTQITADVGTPTSGALGAVNGFGAAADWAARDRDIQLTVKPLKGIGAAWEAITQLDGTLERVNRGQSGHVEGFATGGQVQGFSSGGTVPGRAPSDLSKDTMLAKVDGHGFVGIQPEEFIVKKKAVDFWGTDFMNDINNMKMPRFAGGGSPAGGISAGSNGGPLLVELTAENIQSILRLADRPIDLFADVEKIASTVNEGNRVLASKGVS